MPRLALGSLSPVGSLWAFSSVRFTAGGVYMCLLVPRNRGRGPTQMPTWGLSLQRSFTAQQCFLHHAGQHAGCRLRTNACLLQKAAEHQHQKTQSSGHSCPPWPCVNIQGHPGEHHKLPQAAYKQSKFISSHRSRSRCHGHAPSRGPGGGSFLPDPAPGGPGFPQLYFLPLSSRDLVLSVCLLFSLPLSLL